MTSGQYKRSLLCSPGLMVFVAAFVARLVWVMNMRPEIAWSDELDYLAIARHLVAGDGYLSTSHRAIPGLPFYLSLVFRVFGENYFAARVGQAVAGALTCVLLQRIGTRLVHPTVGLISGMILAIYPPHIYLAGVFYAECLATFLCMLAVYLAIRSLEPNAPWVFGLLTGVAFGLAALTRSVFAVCIPCMCIVWLYTSREGWTKRAIGCALLILGGTIAILPWTVRNYIVYHRVMPISTGFYQQLWWGNNELATGSPEDRFLFIGESFWNERLARLDPSQQAAITEKYTVVKTEIAENAQRYGDYAIAADEVLRPVVTSYIASHPGLTIVRMGKKLVGMFCSAFGATLTKNAYTSPRYKFVAAVSYYPILGLGLVGACLGLARRRELAPVYAVVAAVALVQSIMAVNTRYRLPLDPYLILFAAIALVRVLPRRFHEPAQEVKQ